MNERLSIYQHIGAGILVIQELTRIAVVGLAEKKHLQWCQSFHCQMEVARTLKTAHAIEKR